MMKPVPENRQVTIINADLEPTVHLYAETRVVYDHRGQPGYAFIFVCTKTGYRRRYGIEEGLGLPPPLSTPSQNSLYNPERRKIKVDDQH